MLVSHRGYARSGVRENTIAAFDAAFTHGAQGIETDIRLTADGEIIVHHDDIAQDESGRDMILSQTEYAEFMDRRGTNAERIPILEELFEYIERRSTPFFLELKQPNPIIAETLARFIAERGMWNQVHLIGYNQNIKHALMLQPKFPQLKIAQLFEFPPISRFKKPTKSWGGFTGWLEGRPWTEPVFNLLYPVPRLRKLRERYERMGFHFMGGVPNHEHGVRHFLDAGINDIFTDEVPMAARVIKEYTH